VRDSVVIVARPRRGNAWKSTVKRPQILVGRPR